MSVAVEMFRPALSTRLPGCDERCRPLLVYSERSGGRHWRDDHDPAAHEVHGERQARLSVARPQAVRTGPLVIDRDRSLALVDGRTIMLSPRELQILLCVGSRLGAVVPYRTIMDEVFDDPDGTLYARNHNGSDGWADPYHVIRVWVTRVRRKLGPASRLLVTRRTIGMELIHEAAP